MHKVGLRKPDGRNLTLYGLGPVQHVGKLLSPEAVPETANPHLRWHPLRQEWVAYAPHRQDRTYLPPPSFDPLLPSESQPTELPTGTYDIAVFDNLFPTLSMTAHDPPQLYVDTQPAHGCCEVVVYSQSATASLATLPLEHIALLLEVWGDRTLQLVQQASVHYVLPFENRGAEVGVTLHHPHGQIYAYGTVPPIPERMHVVETGFFASRGQTLISTIVEREIADRVRLLYAGDEAAAFVPVCARFPYEVWIAPRKPVAFLHELTAGQRLDCARALKTVLLKFDGLWARPFPYVMAWFQAPTGGDPRTGMHLHAELFPPYRTRDKLKYLAGTELAAGFFASDALPEQKASELQAVPVSLD
jgi:UDPglucose--hexose-1-phosphate uridylyltransferase